MHSNVQVLLVLMTSQAITHILHICSLRCPRTLFLIPCMGYTATFAEILPCVHAQTTKFVLKLDAEPNPTESTVAYFLGNSSPVQEIRVGICCQECC